MENNNLVKVKFHGSLGKKIGKKIWELSVKSVQEAFHAVNVLSQGKLNKEFLKGHEKNLKYQVKVNNKPVDTENLDIEKLETIAYSDLTINRGNLKTIDILP